MNEDQQRNRSGHGPNNLAELRHMVLNVMQKDASKGSLRGKRKRASWTKITSGHCSRCSDSAITLGTYLGLVEITEGIFYRIRGER